MEQLVIIMSQTLRRQKLLCHQVSDDWYQLIFRAKFDDKWLYWMQNLANITLSNKWQGSKF